MLLKLFWTPHSILYGENVKLRERVDCYTHLYFSVIGTVKMGYEPMPWRLKSAYQRPHPFQARGPFKPAFGLSGAVRGLDRDFQTLVRVFARSIRTRFRLVPRSQSRDGESYSTSNTSGRPHNPAFTGLVCQKWSASPTKRRATRCFSDFRASANVVGALGWFRRASGTR